MMKVLLTVLLLCIFNIQVNSLTYLEGCLTPYEVHMTIDDAPSTNTPAILQAFASRNVSATWFIIGKHVVDLNYYQAIENMMINHTLGSHTYSHTHITQITPWQLRRELHDNELLFRMITGKRPAYWRAPFFDDDDPSVAIVDEYGYTFFDASMDTLDWGLLNLTLIVDSVKLIMTGQNPAYPNATSYIHLEHDWVPETPAALPIIIDYIRSQGYKLVDAVTCTGIQPYVNDTVYDPLLTDGLEFDLMSMIPNGSGGGSTGTTTGRRQLSSEHSHSHGGRSLYDTTTSLESLIAGGCRDYINNGPKKSTVRVLGPNDWDYPAPGNTYSSHPTPTPTRREPKHIKDHHKEDKHHDKVHHKHHEKHEEKHHEKREEKHHGKD